MTGYMVDSILESKMDENLGRSIVGPTCDAEDHACRKVLGRCNTNDTVSYEKHYILSASVGRLAISSLTMEILRNMRKEALVVSQGQVSSLKIMHVILWPTLTGVLVSRRRETTLELKASVT